MPSIAISVLDKTFVVACEAEEWAPFLKDLWSPSLGSPTEAEDVLIHISRTGSEWRLRYGDYLHFSEDPWVIASAIRNFVSVQGLHRSDRITSLHAATVRFEGKVLLLAGASQAGKTTLLLDLVESGWATAGDDLAVLSRAGPDVRTFAKPVHVRDPARWARFRGRWEPPPWVPNPTSSALLPPDSVSMVAGVYRPAGILFPKFDARATAALAPLSPAECVAKCAANCHNPGGVDRPGLTAFVALCRTLPGATLTYPSSRDSVALTRGFLQDLPN
jgi:hypothetical protein